MNGSRQERGSSPRMRGARGDPINPYKTARIIPAYAGSTQIWRIAGLMKRDHPRVCGEHRGKGAAQVRRDGSSPRMRGAQENLPIPGMERRIIPAYAGSTRVAPCLRRTRKDHPRVCGEHSISTRPAFVRRGSSPRMRGAPAARRWIRGRPWIIPAYAGSTPAEDQLESLEQDHPRVCGEHHVWMKSRISTRGSSPRMRGARGRSKRSQRFGRIIPAYAGSTWRPLILFRKAEDHPRVCGEHLSQRHGDQRIQGSSPRMRGALGRVCQDVLWPGIIPAYAGSTHRSARRFDSPRDHPRVCGEHVGNKNPPKATQGSSPRMRGAH